jgi:transposase
VLESCHVGKHAKTYADNDMMAAARTALVYLAGNAPCVWVPDALTCERREFLHACQKAVADHTAATNSLKGYLNQFAIRLGSRHLQFEWTRHWILKQRDWSLLQQELLAAYFADLDGQAQRRKRLQLLIAQQVCAEPLMLRCMKLLGIGMINASPCSRSSAMCAASNGPRSSAGTIRSRLLKIGALITASTALLPSLRTAYEVCGLTGPGA